MEDWIVVVCDGDGTSTYFFDSQDAALAWVRKNVKVLGVEVVVAQVHRRMRTEWVQ